MFKGNVYKRCGCTGPKLDEAGQPVLNAKGNPVMQELGADCPRIRKREKRHGSWYYYLHLPDDARGKRRRPRRGGFLTQKEAETEAQKIWDEAMAGVDVENKTTVAGYLRKWIANRVDLKANIREEYAADIEKFYIPVLGHLTMRELRTHHIQVVFEDIWALNEVKQQNQKAADQARTACEAAHEAWKRAPRPRPRELRQAWDHARARLKAALAQPRRATGPGRQRNLLNVLSGALKHAVKIDKIITENWCDGVYIPPYDAPDPLVWTEGRVARWNATGELPGPVMVWTPEQTGRFLDAAVDHRLYAAFHLMVFRAPRRGEAAGLRWTDVDMTLGTASIMHTLITDRNHKVRTETTKSRASKRTVTLDSATFALLSAWRDIQQEEKAIWKAKRRKNPELYAPYVDSGYVFTMPDGRPWHPDSVSQAFSRLIKRLGLPPIRLHDLRHCAASLSLAAGLSMKAIQALLGHATFALTANTYTSLMPQFAKDEAEATVAVVPRKQIPTGPEGQSAPLPDDAPQLVLVSSATAA
ncbi:tyrosine-type recombinase/integrase [Streptomyces sp. NPDC058734]|uniref:tyrosine-type recombinase/integrase n=1 Tax=Streptomyces sp. NPDC058734 TaxID=3346615 RepID=UPI00367807F1